MTTPRFIVFITLHTKNIDSQTTDTDAAYAFSAQNRAMVLVLRLVSSIVIPCSLVSSDMFIIHAGQWQAPQSCFDVFFYLHQY